MNGNNFENRIAPSTEVTFDKQRLFFNKWEMYKLLAQYDLPFQMPYTAIFSIQSFDQFTSRSIPFYVKPVHTWAGLHITRITPFYNGYHVKQQNGSEETLPTKQALWQKLAQYYQNTLAIIQQQAPTIAFNSRAFDIRVHLQRDEHGQWLYAGDLTRIGGEKSIVSNHFTNGGGVVETEFVLQHLFRYSKGNKVLRTLANATFAISEVLDSQYPFVDIGADFGLDRNGNLWLFEVNTNDAKGRPAYDLFKKLPDKNVYKQMIAMDKRRYKIWKKSNMYF
ncbi:MULTISPECIES: YheC/YheD family protein [Paraliobacillus]|uniref:YheC/YheD family protein n=1 Tax=Paraliobacillus TaxID=200903 RepID=UPI000DD380BD|nr:MULTISPECIES: YheC/YheD family protein [Paraliobacillus]